MTDTTTPSVPSTTFETFTISRFDHARLAYRERDLRQALYDEGDVIMGDVLVNLHADEHRARRRLENRLFRRDAFTTFERELFPPIMEATLAPYIAEGRTELVHVGHSMMMNLAAFTAGVDRPLGTADETDRLYAFLMVFIEGATLAHYVGDKAAKKAEVADALQRFDEEFLAPSVARRNAFIESGRAEELPLDVLSILLRNQDDLHLEPHVVRREIAFYLLAGAHTSATALVRCVHQILSWIGSHPDDAIRTREPLWVQRAIHETVRLEPSSPVAMRWALADLTLPDGTAVPKGSKVIIDLMSVNRDPDVFGADAAEFNPYRSLPSGVLPYGLSFGSGMHACIGQDLAAGVLPVDGHAQPEHIYGLVSGAVQALFDHGVQPDPTEAPSMNPASKRPYWGRYPVVFNG
jgi:cytochrome P450